MQDRIDGRTDFVHTRLKEDPIRIAEKRPTAGMDRIAETVMIDGNAAKTDPKSWNSEAVKTAERLPSAERPLVSFQIS